MKLITLDFETFYSKDFSLSKVSTEEYIRSPLFETIMVAVKEDDNETEWFSGTHEQTKKFLDKFDWANAAAVAHNAAFDMAILNWRFNIRPKRIVDTLSMGRALYGNEVGVGLASLAKFFGLGEKGHEVVNALGKQRTDFTREELNKYAEYCVNDVELTYKLVKEMLGEFPLSELKLIDMTIRMFSEPVLELDKPLLETHLKDVQEKKMNLLMSALVERADLMSNGKFAELLRANGVEPPTKVSKTTGKETYAFAKSDEDFLALKEHENPVIQALVSARIGNKSTLEETRTEAFIGISGRGTLPVPLRYYGAHTGRYSAQDGINLQNLPRKSNLKKSIRAPNGYKLIDCDSSQIECRMLAWLAGQDDLVEAFERGEDVYCIMASVLYGRTITKADEEQRFVGKTVVLGSGYGTGWKKLQDHMKTNPQQRVDMSAEEAKRTIDTYRDAYAKIPLFWKQCDRALDIMSKDQYTEFGPGGVIKVIGKEGILLPNGMRLKYPNLHKTADGFVYHSRKGRTTFPKSIWGGGLTENICQALARIAVMDQMLEIAKRYRVVLTVHDSVISLVPESEGEEALKYVTACMRKRPPWGPELPLNCEAKIGHTYGG